MRLSVGGRIRQQTNITVVKQFTRYVCDKFILPVHLKKTSVTIDFVNPNSLAKSDRKELRKFSAWMESYGRYQHVITVDANVLPKRVGRSQQRHVVAMEDALLCVGHELVHVKQYVNGEMRDYANQDVWYMGRRYTDWKDDANYYASPWEMEAYALESELYQQFLLATR